MNLIDRSLTREQVLALGPDVAERLLAAADRDFRSWSDQLLAAWAAGDADAVRLARHAIRGLCANFGAAKLSAMAEDDLTSRGARSVFLNLRDATLDAIRAAAQPVGET